ncbi:16S rRNA (uracil(1498)-N(3))-methyltransferase [Desulforamulus ruminis]|uniref:Ribosomal RNA small subunit methyltransferase E n=1 Tax=Desulforamulus ruminis (strain ATCC 23193 / DSM 2154 / NCIMB 8452 / DL) TaxID=696281 RepID=F6DMV7_DESRL|nr:16S rRNA (uracil(1498)-N(3))-methyltransferase [Desulforamulus ruminis]AEG59415.1 protein of unknown function DUF558 [Desulforamulus ruminis DSM 2154]
MARFFVEPRQIKEDTAVVYGPDVKHISKVLRMDVGEILTLLDGSGTLYRAEISEISKEEIRCRILQREQSSSEPRLKVTLVQGLPKGDKMETIIQKCTELGIDQIIPLAAERSVVKLDAKKSAERQERWQRVAMEAAKQCRRSAVPRIHKLCRWEELAEKIPLGARGLIPWEDEKKQSLKQVLEGMEHPGEVYILIGPEGGLEVQEVARACAQGFRPVTLGPRILRTETAGPAVLTMVLYHFGELG